MSANHRLSPDTAFAENGAAGAIAVPKGTQGDFLPASAGTSAGLGVSRQLERSHLCSDECVGKMRASHGFFLDLASEEIACSSGVLLTDQNLKTITVRYDIDELSYLERGEKETVIRPEDFEDAVLSVREAIGSLPDTKPSQFVLMDACMALEKKGADAMKIAQAYLTISESGKYASVNDEATEEIIAISGADRMHVDEFLFAVSGMHERKMSFLYGRVRRKQWDGAVALDRLFQGEHIPNDSEVYLDQRYIDYLAKNGEDMGKIHWRNFERLTTEFFRRQGYEVDLGPGTKDGGVDVRVWTDRESREGPPLLLVQCKRYNYVVGIETVKAFWSDVHFEGAEKGLIATTSSVSRDSKRVCEVRKWPMSFAEAAEVKRWARTMWRHAPEIANED
jgi:restriction system protein